MSTENPIEEQERVLVLLFLEKARKFELRLFISSMKQKASKWWTGKCHAIL